MSIALAAERLRTAARDRLPCAPVRDLIGAADVAAAYAVQRTLTIARVRSGDAVVGRKVGLTSQAVRAQLGVDRPDFGVLFASMRMTEEHPVPAGLLLQPKVEAEIAFVLSRNVTDPDTDPSDWVACAAPALEVVESRIADWDISLGDTIADNASSGLFVLGQARAALDEFDPVATRMVLSRNGEVVARGTGADCLGNPLDALRWLAATALETGEPLLAGQVVLSGALGPMASVRPGDTVHAQLSGLGGVGLTFAGEGP